MDPISSRLRLVLRLAPLLFASGALGCATYVDPGWPCCGSYRSHHSTVYQYGRPSPAYGYGYRQPVRVVPYPVYVPAPRRHHDDYDDAHRHRRHHDRHDHGGRHAQPTSPPAPPAVTPPPAHAARDVNGHPRARRDESPREEQALPGRLERRPSYGGRRRPEVAEARDEAPVDRRSLRPMDRGGAR